MFEAMLLNGSTMATTVEWCGEFFANCHRQFVKGGSVVVVPEAAMASLYGGILPFCHPPLITLVLGVKMPFWSLYHGSAAISWKNLLLWLLFEAHSCLGPLHYPVIACYWPLNFVLSNFLSELGLLISNMELHLCYLQELGTDVNLYALVFGESVLNDAVSSCCWRMYLILFYFLL